MSATTPTRPLLATIFGLNLIEFLQNGMVAFAAVPIMGQVSASPEEFSAITALYAAVAVVSIALMVPLVQRLGWRDYVLASVAVFCAGALVSAASHSAWQFASGRMLMAAGGGAFMTAARMLVNLIPPSPQRIKGIAAFGIALSLGLAGAPALAAGAVAADDWSRMFLILVAIAGCVAALAYAFLPADAAGYTTPAKADWPSGLLLGTGAFLALYALQRAVYDFHAERLALAPWLGLGLVALGWFALRQRAARAPFLRLSGLTGPRYLTGLAVFTLCYIVLGATNSMLPLFVQRALGVGIEAAGHAQSAGLLGALAGFVSVILVVRTRPGARKFYVAAFLLLAAFGWSQSRLNGEANLWRDVMPPLAMFGAFLTLAMATTALQAFRELQHDEVLFSNGQQLKNMLSQFGLGLGIALANNGFQARVAQHYTVLGERVAERAALTPFADLPLPQVAQHLAQQSALLAGLDYFWLLAWVGLALAAVMLAQRVFD